MKIAIIGLGLIGGSFAKSFKEKGLSSEIIGVDQNPEHGKMALNLGLIDKVASLEGAVQESDLILVTTPVNTISGIVNKLLDLVEDQIVMDAGSTKLEIIEKVRDHPKRRNFVAAHPMAGTEHSGPQAAISGLYENKYVVICNKEESDESKVTVVSNLLSAIGMKLLYQDAESHDTHVAYVSHISHISSFALAITVLNKEQDEGKIFELASTGFSSTVRLAKSSPETWVPIFEHNRDNVLDVLDEHITVLSNFRSHLIKKNYDAFHEMICDANKIKKILK